MDIIVCHLLFVFLFFVFSFERVAGYLCLDRGPLPIVSVEEN